MDLEAGQGLLLLSEFISGWLKGRNSLTRETKELVMFELDASYFSDWKSEAGNNCEKRAGCPVI
jgi:hypothetical protein